MPGCCIPGGGCIGRIGDIAGAWENACCWLPVLKAGMLGGKFVCEVFDFGDDDGFDCGVRSGVCGVDVCRLDASRGLAGVGALGKAGVATLVCGDSV